MSTQDERPLIFPCGADRLVGVVHHTETKSPRAGVLVIVGGPQYRVGSHRQFILMARELARHGYPVMRFDYRGMGDSEGQVRGFELVDDDILAATDAFFSSVPSLSQVVLWGLCDGASAAAMYARRDSRVAGLVLVNPWVRTPAGEAKAYVQHYYARRLLQGSFWRKLLTGRLEVLPAVRDFLLTLGHARAKKPVGAPEGARQGFVERMYQGLGDFERPVMVLISGRDLTAAEFVTLCNEDPRWKRLLSRSNVCLVRLDEADHTFSGRLMLASAIESCAAWLHSALGGDCAPRSAVGQSGVESVPCR